VSSMSRYISCLSTSPLTCALRMEVFVGSFPYRVAAAKDCHTMIRVAPIPHAIIIQQIYPVVTDTSTMYVCIGERIAKHT
jgi:hypothetical protein